MMSHSESFNESFQKEFNSIAIKDCQDIFSLTFRTSRPEVFCKKGVLRNFTKSTGKHLYQSLRPATLLKKDTYSGTGVFR